MRRSSDKVLHSIKDGIRSVRYSIRAEVQTPGAMLPKTVASVDMKPFVTAGAVVSTPAFKAVDALISYVGTLATEVMPQARGAAFPAPIDVFFAEGVSFHDLLYAPYQNLLLARGAHNVFLSEHSFARAQAAFQLRFGDSDRANVAKNCAGLTVVLCESRPIRKLDIETGIGGSPQLLLDPNMYCAAVFGVVTALVTRDPELRHDLAAVQESVEWVVNARFDRFKRALSGRSPIVDLCEQFEAMLPFLP